MESEAEAELGKTTCLLLFPSAPKQLFSPTTPDPFGIQTNPCQKSR